MARGNAGNLVGKTLGRYQLITLLGAGGMAEVYRGRDLSLGRDVAVKVLPATLAADPEYVERFRSEARRVARLRHPNIVPVYEFDEQDGLLYLVMPLVPESLRDRMQRDGLLPISDAIGIAIQVAGALEAAHAQGIVHRDVKPENVLLDADGHALLTDFGIARELAFLRRSNAVQTLAATGLPVGTPEYMAPEQLRNGPIDQRADVYALGAVLYELLTGRAPHEAATPYEVAALALTAPIARPVTRNPRIWPELDAAVMIALAPDAQDRFPSVAAFAQTVRQASRRGTGVGGVIRATLPIFRKTGVVDPFEGPTDQVLAVTGGRRATNGARPSAIFMTRARAIPTAPVAPLPWRREQRRRWQMFMRIGAVLALALAIAGSGLAILRGLSATGGRGPSLVVVPSPTATATATATKAPTATPRPTHTPVPPATATPVPRPSVKINPAPWQTYKSGSRYCYSTISPSGPQTITNIGLHAVSWNWLSLNPTVSGNFNWEPHGTSTWLGGLPSQSSLAPGKSFQLDVKLSCSSTQSYTVTILVTDNVTGARNQVHFTLTAVA